MNNKKYYFTYQTKNLINGKTYIGIHKTNDLNDGYIGCGIYRLCDANYAHKRARKTSPFPLAVIKHGYENFKLEVLCFFNNWEECLEEEAFLVNTEWVKDKSNYNACLGGGNAAIPNSVKRLVEKIVYQFDNQGVLVNKWFNIFEALDNGFTLKGINRSIREDRTYKSFKWSYKNYCEPFKLHSGKNGKIVYKYDLNRKFICSYKNVREASAKSGLHYGNIGNVCQGTAKTAGGFIWSYEKLVDDIV